MIRVIGGGLAGSEAAWQAASRGVPVALYEMRPVRPTEVHKTDRLAELVCSNSFRGDKLDNAVGLLKEEMRRLGSLVMRAAEAARVPAGAPWRLTATLRAGHRGVASTRGSRSAREVAWCPRRNAPDLATGRCFLRSADIQRLVGASTSFYEPHQPDRAGRIVDVKVLARRWIGVWTSGPTNIAGGCERQGEWHRPLAPRHLG
jgi:tRNA:m(5)U-54 methyltransferase